MFRRTLAWRPLIPQVTRRVKFTENLLAWTRPRVGFIPKNGTVIFPCEQVQRTCCHFIATKARFRKRNLLKKVKRFMIALRASKFETGFYVNVEIRKLRGVFLLNKSLFSKASLTMNIQWRGKTSDCPRRLRSKR